MTYSGIDSGVRAGEPGRECGNGAERGELRGDGKWGEGRAGARPMHACMHHGAPPMPRERAEQPSRAAKLRPEPRAFLLRSAAERLRKAGAVGTEGA